MRERRIKVGLKKGQGPPPGYQWNVLILNVADDEIRKLLTDVQHDHMKEQVKELARQPDPTHSNVVDVRKMRKESFHEIRDKGGVLGRMNVRVFFGVDTDVRAIVILGGILKQNDGATPDGDRIRMQRRWRKYRKGEFGKTT